MPNKMDQTISHYDQYASKYQEQYDSVQSDAVHADWLPLLNNLEQGTALDIGAGSGRDAYWLFHRGWRVVAVEPASRLREMGMHKTGSSVEWYSDTLPRLEKINVPQEGFNLILLSAVWMHLPSNLRNEAMQRLSAILAPNGVMIITLRFGPTDPARPMYLVSTDELENLANQVGLQVYELSTGEVEDALQRQEVTWKVVALKPLGGK